MKVALKIFVLTFLVGSIIFARSGKTNPRLEKKNEKSEYYWVKDYSEGNGNKQLDRKRSHKRRRKVRKPVKGLR